AAQATQPRTEASVPDVRLHLALADGHVLFHGPGGDTALGDIALELRVDGLDHPAPFRMSLAARGPSGTAGTLALEGAFTAARGGRMDPPAWSGDLALTLAALDLAALEPAVALVAPVAGLGGVLSGKTELHLA